MGGKAKYLLSRLIQAFFIVLLLSFITFNLSVNSPLDPLDYFSAPVNESDADLSDNSFIETQKQRLREKMGYNLPTFYIKLASFSHSKNFYFLNNRELKTLLNTESWKGYNGEKLLRYLKRIEQDIFASSKQALVRVRRSLIQTGFYESIEKHDAFIEKLKLENQDTLANELAGMLATVKQSKSSFRSAVPKLFFYGKNQYAIWLFGNGNERKGVFRGDFGTSVINGKPVIKRILKALPWTFGLSLITIVLSFITSIILGLALGYFNNKWWSKGLSSFLFLLYTVPSFWLGTLLLVFFANPDYLAWFPPGGIKPITGYASMQNYSSWSHFLQSIPYIILPVVVLSYGNIAVLTRYIKSSTVGSLSSMYTFSARTRGLTEKKVLFKHVFKNVMLPMVTIIGAIIPGLFSGSIIVEVIFSIPGMGLALTDAVLQNDINMAVAIFAISAALSAIGYLVSDILYTLIDPRIKLEKL